MKYEEMLNCLENSVYINDYGVVTALSTIEIMGKSKDSSIIQVVDLKIGDEISILDDDEEKYLVLPLVDFNLEEISDIRIIRRGICEYLNNNG